MAELLDYTRSPYGETGRCKVWSNDYRLYQIFGIAWDGSNWLISADDQYQAYLGEGYSAEEPEAIDLTFPEAWWGYPVAIYSFNSDDSVYDCSICAGPLPLPPPPLMQYRIVERIAPYIRRR